MKEQDDWGRDPSVRTMREVFSRMESVQDAFLREVGLSVLDRRLGPWRRKALSLFERSWIAADRKGVPLGAEEAATVYVRCMAAVMEKDGIAIPAHVLPEKGKVRGILDEVLT